MDLKNWGKNNEKIINAVNDSIYADAGSMYERQRC